MNFLAHLYLSNHDPQVMVGNFIGDSVKGHDYEKYPEGIKQGILLHRAIDDFSDKHAVFVESVKRLYPVYHKYAGVIIDIYYDHFLARDWKHYSEIPLENFVKEVHKLMLKNIVWIPGKSLMFLKYAIRTNRLVSYASLDGIEEVLHGMSRRTTFKSNMEKAANELKQYYTEFESEFRQFFPEIRKFSEEFMKRNR